MFVCVLVCICVCVRECLCENVVDAAASETTGSFLLPHCFHFSSSNAPCVFLSPLRLFCFLLLQVVKSFNDMKIQGLKARAHLLPVDYSEYCYLKGTQANSET